MSSDKRGLCGRCGKGYAPYIIAWKEGFVNMVNFASIRREWGYVCPECLEKETGGEGYVTWEDKNAA